MSAIPAFLQRIAQSVVPAAAGPSGARAALPPRFASTAGELDLNGPAPAAASASLHGSRPDALGRPAPPTPSRARPAGLGDAPHETCRAVPAGDAAEPPHFRRPLDGRGADREAMLPRQATEPPRPGQIGHSPAQVHADLDGFAAARATPRVSDVQAPQPPLPWTAVEGRSPLRESTVARHAALTRPAVAAQPTIVQVTIDRIDVRSAAPAPAPRPAARPRGTATVSLADYLQPRRGDRS